MVLHSCRYMQKWPDVIKKRIGKINGCTMKKSYQSDRVLAIMTIRYNLAGVPDTSTGKPR